MNFKKSNLFSLVFAFLLFGFVGFFLTYPSVSNLQSNLSILEKKQVELSALNEKVEILQKASKAEGDYKLMIDKLAVLWPDNQDVSRFMIQTEDLAKKENAVLENFTINQVSVDKKKAEDKKGPNKSYVQYSFSSKTSYPIIFDLIKNMERLDRFNTINQISLNLTDDGSVSGSMSGNIYYGK